MDNNRMTMDNELRIVQGNTFATAIEIHAVDATGQPIVDWSLQDSTDLRVWYVFAGREQDITTWQISDGKLVILWLANMQRVGTYDILCAGKYNGADWRNAMQYQFRIVRFNHEANIPANVVILDGVYQLSAELQIITQFAGGGGTPSQTLPLMDGEPSVGEENAYARGDHRHPSDTGKQDTITDLQAIRDGAAAGATAYQKPTGGIPAADMSQSVQDALSNANSAVQPAAIADMATEGYVDGKVSAEQTRAENAEGNLQDAIEIIEAVIPAAASSSNQLADKDFVNSSINTNTATFRGTYNSLAELQQVTATNNDYAFVIETDAVGNEYYDRYKYNGSQWLFEYKVESTPFTSAQWAAIQSGITSALVTKLGALPTAQQLNDALAEKQDKIDANNKLSADLVDDNNTTHKFVTEAEKTAWNNKQDALESGTNIKTLNGKSVLGAGNLETAFPVVNHGTSDTTYALTPNVCHIWGVVDALNLTLAAPEDSTVANEYWFIFQSGATATNVTLPNGLLWDSNIDTTSQFIEANTTYEFHICNGIVRVGGAV